MGAPKQKWTAEEEQALKAGIEKHGTGKWRTILQDPEFAHALHLRSNVNLKDKARSMSVTADGWGYWDRARLSYATIKSDQKHDDKPLALGTMDEDFEDEIVEELLVVSGETSNITASESSISRLDTLVFEAITNLMEPAGSSLSAIGLYIEENYRSPPDLESMLSAKLRTLTTNGRLIKVKDNVDKYRIAPTLGFSDHRAPRSFLLGTHKISNRADRDDYKTPSKDQIDAEIAKMRKMSAREAATIAKKAMAEAEAAIAEAEEAAREAEIAEAEAEAAKAFAEFAMVTLKSRKTGKTKLNIPSTDRSGL